MSNTRTVTITVAVAVSGYPNADELAQSVYEDLVHNPLEDQQSVELVSVSQVDSEDA